MAAPVATRILPKPGNYSGTGTAAHSHYSFDFDGPAYDLANVPNGTLIMFACSWGHEHSAAVVAKADAGMKIRAGNVADYSGDPATLDEVTGPWSALSFAVSAPSSVIVIHYGLIYGILGDGTGGTIDKSQFDVTTGGASRITIQFTDDAGFYPLTDSWLTPVVTVYEPIAGFEVRVDAALIDEISDAVATGTGIATLDLPGFTPPRSDNTSIVRAEAIAAEFTAGDPSGWSESFTPVDFGSISGWNRGWHIRQDGSPSAIAASSIDVTDGLQPDGVAAILVRSIYWEAVGNTAPTDPTSVTGEAGNGEATCTWVDGTGSPSPTWDVEIAPGPSFTAWTSVAADLAQGTQTATATGLTNGTDYRFRVRGQNTEGDSAWVESATFTPTAITRDVRFQTGTVDVTTDGQTVTLPTPVGSLENAFVFIAGNRHQGAGPVGSAATQHADDMGVVAELTAVDTITFQYDGGNGTRVQWVVMEYVGAPGGANEFIVRGRHNFTFTSNANQTTALTTAPTNVDKVIPFIRGISSTHASAGANNLGARAWLDNTGNTLNVACSREDDTTTVGVTAVEFTGSNWSVGHMAWNGATSDGPIDRPLVQEADGDSGGTSFDVGDWATAAIMSWGHASDDANEAIADGWPLWEPTPSSTTQVRWTFDANHDGADDDYVVHVLQHDDLAVTRYSDTSSAADETTIDVTSAGLTDLARSLVLGTSITSGSGTAYGRGWRLYYLNSLTEAAHWSHRSGNTMAHRLQVIDFEAVTSTTAAASWSGSASSLTITATAGAFVPAAASWSGSTSVLEVSSAGGAFVAGAASWSGSTSVLHVASPGGAFVPAAASWSGSTSVLEVSSAGGAFVAGAASWSGSASSLTITATAGAFVAGAASWSGSTSVLEVSSAGGAFVAGAASWSGSTSVLHVASPGGAFVPAAASWSGSTSVLEVSSAGGAFVAGAASWSGSASSLTITATAGAFVAGAASWPGSTSALTVTSPGGVFTAGALWAGSTSVLHVASPGGAFVPAAATWSGSTSSLAVTSPGGAFDSSSLWAGSPSSLAVSSAGGAFVAGAASWSGSTSVLAVTSPGGAFDSSSLWAGSPASLAVTSPGGAFVPAALTWSGSSTTLAVTSSGGAFVPALIVWTGSTSVVEVTSPGGAFDSSALWAGSTTSLTFASSGGAFVPGAATWSGSASSLTITSAAGAFVGESLYSITGELCVIDLSVERAVVDTSAERELLDQSTERGIVT